MRRWTLLLTLLSLVFLQTACFEKDAEEVTCQKEVAEKLTGRHEKKWQVVSFKVENSETWNPATMKERLVLNSQNEANLLQEFQDLNANYALSWEFQEENRLLVLYDRKTQLVFNTFQIESIDESQMVLWAEENSQYACQDCAEWNQKPQKIRLVYQLVR
ncbi:hypothetical protein [Hugenholtzia roseola]|uniref:hypothetical protein n=1 Tax=Hugenholtzia roseola TaxID=1002 RepID=UPI000416BC3D|nr:hypothetical protein [Hugenholtzia roseola]